MDRKSHLKVDRFDHHIRKKLSDHQVDPPADLWNAIETQLDKEKTAAPFLWRRLAAAAAILLMMTTTSLYFFNRWLTFDEQIADQVLPEEIQTADILQDGIAETLMETDISIASEDPSQPVNPAFYHEKTSDSSRGRLISTASDVTSAALLSEESRSSEPEFLKTNNAGKNILMIDYRPVIATREPVIVAHSATPIAFAVEIDEMVGKARTSNGWVLAAHFAPQQSYHFQNSAVSSPLQPLESELLSFSAGVNIRRNISNRWQVQTGVGYSKIGQIVHNIASFSHPSMMPVYSSNGSTIGEHPQSMSTSMGGIVFTNQSYYFADISSSRIITLKGSYDESNVNLLNKSSTGLIQQFEYLQIPIIANYKIIDNALKVYTKTGISADYLLSGDVFLKGYTRTLPVGKTVGVHRFNITGIAGLGFSYPVNNRVSISLEPTASMFLRPMGPVRNLTSETYPYNWSVMMGISYEL